MNRISPHILLVFTFIFCGLLTSNPLFAQENKEDTTVSVNSSNDSEIVTVQENDSLYQESPHSPNPDSSTLFFVGKADSTMMYDTSSIVLRKVPDSIGNSLKSDDDFWYANKLKGKKKPEENDGFWDKFWLALGSIISKVFFQSILWIILIFIFIGIIVWLLVQNNISVFGRGNNTQLANGSNSDEEDISTINFPVEISNAEQNNDFRLATRLQFLQLLRILSVNKKIEYARDKTNMDYLMQLFNTPIYDDFFKVTRNYEYVWYGNFEINAMKYEVIRNEFSKLNQILQAS